MGGISETLFLSDQGKRLSSQKRVGQIDHAAFEPSALDVSTDAVTLRTSDGKAERVAMLARTPTEHLAPMAVTVWTESGFKLNSVRARLACELGALVYQANRVIALAGKPAPTDGPQIPLTSETSTPCCSGLPPGGSTRRWRRSSGRRRWKIASTGPGC